MYLSNLNYKRYFNDNNIMAYTFNVKADRKKTEKVIEKIVNEYGDTSYRSKETYKKEFQNLKRGMKLIGIILSVAASFIALINLLNILVTSVLSRKKEIATLRSIGMTKGQVRTMLFFEAAYYTALAYILMIFVTVILNNTFLKTLCNSFDFMQYKMPIAPYLFILLAIISFVGVIIVLIEKKIDKDGIVSQIREL